jgi:uncharacterized membrane protein YbaN (DUF454 family)
MSDESGERYEVLAHFFLAGPYLTFRSALLRVPVHKTVLADLKNMRDVSRNTKIVIALSLTLIWPSSARF